MGRGVRISEIVTSSPEETLEFGKQLGSLAQKNSLFTLFGDLGAGKTTLVKGIVEGVTKTRVSVTSPTFVYLNIYNSGNGTVYHFDLYRLKNEREFLSLGFEEYLYGDGVVCIEWSERIASLLPEGRKITLTNLDENRRKIIYEN